MSDCPTMTPMQAKMRLLLAKAAEKRAQDIAVLPDSTDPVLLSGSRLAGGFRASLDDGTWIELATARGLFLPRNDTPCTTGGMERWLRKLGLSLVWYQDFTGFSKLADWPTRNPSAGLRTFAGILLEELQP